jgi:hypothetical protein
MRLAQHTIWIARTPEEVFDFFIDFSQASRWRQYVRTMELTGAPPVRAGSLVKVTMDLSGGAYVFDLEVLACQRPSLWRHRTHESDFSGFIEYRFEPDHAGTRVTMTMNATPRGFYGWLAAPLMLLRRNQMYAEQLPRLKRALETP